MKRLLLAGPLVAVVVVAFLVAGFRSSDDDAPNGSADPSTHRSDSRAAGLDAAVSTERFFAGYVGADGRAPRSDQGGDTVSEGQAYAMVLAVAAGDAGRFAAVWSWTQQHLQRADGLLAWRWSDGQVVGGTASDADLDAAAALALAADRFGAGGRTAARPAGSGPPSST